MGFLEKFEIFCKENGIVKKNGEINIAAFSKASGIPYTTIISWYENGTDNIKLSTLTKLRNYTKLSLDYWVIDGMNIEDDEETNCTELDNLLFSKAKPLSDEDKKVILSVIDSINKDIDKELNIDD